MLARVQSRELLTENTPHNHSQTCWAAAPKTKRVHTPGPGNSLLSIHEENEFLCSPRNHAEKCSYSSMYSRQTGTIPCPSVGEGVKCRLLHQNASLQQRETPCVLRCQLHVQQKKPGAQRTYSVTPSTRSSGPARHLYGGWRGEGRAGAGRPAAVLGTSRIVMWMVVTQLHTWKTSSFRMSKVCAFTVCLSVITQCKSKL